MIGERVCGIHFRAWTDPALHLENGTSILFLVVFFSVFRFGLIGLGIRIL
jgi:hypothetical protein